MDFKIAKVLDDCKVVMNAGSNRKISNGQKYLIYQLSDEEIIDPDTNKSLGFLEIVKGTGTVTHVQDNMATLESCEREKSSKIIRRSGLQKKLKLPSNLLMILRSEIFSSVLIDVHQNCFYNYINR